MVEAVGERYWPAYLDCIARNLKPGGKAALQFICDRPRLFDAMRAAPTSSRPIFSPAAC